MGSSKNDSDFDEHDGLIVLGTEEEISSAKKQKYRVITEDAVRASKEDRIATVADLILVPPAFAAAVLRQCNWSALVVQERWLSDEKRVREDVGLPSSGAPVALKHNDVPLTCALCFDEYSAGQMRSAGCAHFYCVECWRGYLHAAVVDGERCLSLRCPDLACSVAVVRDLVHDVAADEEKSRYNWFELRSYVEENEMMSWCPSPRCTLAVEYLDDEHEQVGVECSCGQVFCILCTGEPHRPVSCDTVRKWMAKKRSESETSKWMLANSKNCPKCRRPIEKSDGCNHMTCRAPCHYDFCWLCLGSWRDHISGAYQCDRYIGGPDNRREQARASLDRYLHYHERWVAHEMSRQRAREDVVELRSAMAACGAANEARTQIGSLINAYKQITDGHQMLRWTCAYGFYADGLQLTLLECLQGEAEASLERLHGFAELECNCAVMDFDGGVSYFKKLANLTEQTANHFEGMAEALEAENIRSIPARPLPSANPARPLPSVVCPAPGASMISGAHASPRPCSPVCPVPSAVPATGASSISGARASTRPCSPARRRHQKITGRERRRP
ncbi:hypothetical protein ACQ4PT_052518 [Festuca glaucescens]